MNNNKKKIAVQVAYYFRNKRQRDSNAETEVKNKNEELH